MFIILQRIRTGTVSHNSYSNSKFTDSTNELITTITKTSHQNQIAHNTNKMLTAQTKTLTAQTKTFTAQRKALTAPRNRGGLLCLFLD